MSRNSSRILDQKYLINQDTSVQYENSYRGGGGDSEVVDLLELAIVHLAHLYGASGHQSLLSQQASVAFFLLGQVMPTNANDSM